jgi:hypothetical protein
MKSDAKYHRKYYLKHRVKLLKYMQRYRAENRGKWIEYNKRRINPLKILEKRKCVQCMKPFIPSSKKNTICSDRCRVARLREYIRRYGKENRHILYEKDLKRDISKIHKFYNENPASIYMPERGKLVEKHKGMIADWRIASRVATRKREKTDDMTLGQAIAVHNFEFKKESGKMEQIDLETLKGLPSEHKDAIIKALFDALKAKKEQENAQLAQPRERKVSKKGEIFLEFSRMRDGEFISFEELAKKLNMKPMTLWNGIYNLMLAGYVSMTMTKLSPMSSDWLEKHVYFGWK